MGSGVGQGVAAAAIERAHVYADHRKGVKTPSSWRLRRVDEPNGAGSGHRDDARGKSASGRENRSVRLGEAVLRRRLHGIVVAAGRRRTISRWPGGVGKDDDSVACHARSPVTRVRASAFTRPDGASSQPDGPRS